MARRSCPPTTWRYWRKRDETSTWIVAAPNGLAEFEQKGTSVFYEGARDLRARTQWHATWGTPAYFYAEVIHKVPVPPMRELMRKDKLTNDEMRAEFQREDLGQLVRGKYAALYAKESDIVVIDPALTTTFPKSEVVNEALHGLLTVGTLTTRLTGRTSGRHATESPFSPGELPWN